MLQDTGTLRASIKPEYSDDNARVFTNLEYSAVHNFGYKPKNIPKREYMYVSEKAYKKLLDLAQMYMRAGV